MKRILAALVLSLALGGCSDPPGWEEYRANSEELILVTDRLEDIAPYTVTPEYQLEADQLIHRRIALENSMREYIIESELWSYYDKEQRRGALKAFSSRQVQAKEKLQKRGFIEIPIINNRGH